MTLPYLDIDTLVSMINGSNGRACQRLLNDNHTLFRQAPGSSYNHQAWEGGYLDHITEAMNIWVSLYEWFLSTGRLEQLPRNEQFNRSDGLIVLFVHDLEKPWRYELRDGKPVADENGRLRTWPGQQDKAARKQFVNEKMEEYGIELSATQRNALDYVEGIRDSDYSPFDRRMWPLAALCHACDMFSARLFYDFPLITGDGWGANRAAQQ